MKQVKEILKDIGINNEPKEENGSYIVELSDSDEFAFAYSRLDKCDYIDLENIEVEENGTKASYLSDDYDITLYGDYDKDIYTLTFERATE